MVDGGLAAGQGSSATHPLDLQSQILKADGVVLVAGTLALNREDHVQILAPARDKSSPALGRRNLKATIELGYVVLAKKAVGILHSLDATQPQLLRQPSLPRGEVALAAAARLRGVVPEHLHCQLAHSPSHLGQPVGIDLTSGLGSKPKMRAPVTVRSAEQPLLFDHLPHVPHYSHLRSLFTH